MNEITRDLWTGYKRQGSEKGPEWEVESKQFWILCRVQIMFLIKVPKSSKEDWMWAKENRGRHSTELVPSTFLRAEDNSGIFLFAGIWSHHVSFLSYPGQERHLTWDNRNDLEWSNKTDWNWFFKWNFYLVLWCHWSIVILH